MLATTVASLVKHRYGRANPTLREDDATWRRDLDTLRHAELSHLSSLTKGPPQRPGKGCVSLGVRCWHSRGKGRVGISVSGWRQGVFAESYGSLGHGHFTSVPKVLARFDMSLWTKRVFHGNNLGCLGRDFRFVLRAPCCGVPFRMFV